MSWNKGIKLALQQGTLMASSTRLYFLIPAVLLVLAIFPLPYGYYTFLRLVVTFSALLAAYTSFKANGSAGWEVVVMVLLAVLFNPLVPIWLSRPVWMPIDLVSGGLFAYLALRKAVSAA